MTNMFGLRLDHKAQVQEWETWTLEKQEEVLECIRTGTKTNDVATALDGYAVKDLFYVKAERTNGWSGSP